MLGLVKATILSNRIPKIKLEIDEIAAATICNKFYIYNVVKIYLQTYWIFWSQKLKSSLLQKHVFTFGSDVVLATLNYMASIPAQLTALVWMKILHRATRVEQITIKSRIIKIANITLDILLHHVISKLSQFIY